MVLLVVTGSTKMEDTEEPEDVQTFVGHVFDDISAKVSVIIFDSEA